MLGTRIRAILIFALMLLSVGGSVVAAEFPSRPITIIVPYAAGGAGDTIARLLSPSLEKTFSQPIVVESRAGGGGTIGARTVAQSTPDGHVLLLGAANNFVINQFMFPKVKFDPLKEFTPIVRVADVPSVIYSSIKVPAATLSEFVAYAKANPGKLNYASPSIGTTPHLAVELLKQLAGVNIVHVPHRGAALAMQSLIQNDVQLYLAGWGVGRQFVESGKIRALAITTQHRQAGIPIPTAIEAGIPGFVAANWWGLAAPSGTPKAAVATIYRAVTIALKDKSVTDRLAVMGFIPGKEGPEEFAQNIHKEAAMWEATVKKGNLAVDP